MKEKAFPLLETPSVLFPRQAAGYPKMLDLEVSLIHVGSKSFKCQTFQSIPVKCPFTLANDSQSPSGSVQKNSQNVFRNFYPPTQKTPGASPGMNAPGLRSRSGSFGGVGLDGPSVARSAKEAELLRRIPPKKLKIPRE